MLDFKSGDLVHYEVEEGGRLEFEIVSRYTFDYEDLATDMAEDYHSNHDGWESNWPVEMVIYEYSENEDGVELWRGSVDREAQPVFYATRKETSE